MRWGAAGAILLVLAGTARAAEPGWAFYGGDAGGQRYSAAAEITPANVANLKPAWRFSTHDLATKGEAIYHASFEDTPILADGKLYVCSPFNEVSALDPGTGHEIWRFDPKVDFSHRYPNELVCRGVAYWRPRSIAFLVLPDPKAKTSFAGVLEQVKRMTSGICSSRIFMVTNDRRLIALDAETGTPCVGFGDHGTVYMTPFPKMIYPTEVQNTSAPVVTHGVVIVGSSIGDNGRVDEPRGTVRAFDAVTGRPRWTFDPVPRSPSAPNAASWTGKGASVTGAANVWAPISVDEAHGIVYLPTTSPSPDFYGGTRPGDNRYADSVVAVNAQTGQVVWSFQVTHHDVWDYDIPAEPTLGVVTYKGKTTPALIQATKQGFVFTLDRMTGAPLIPVEERRVPQGGAPGEQLSPTQPFPIVPKQLSPSRIKSDDAFGLTFWDRGVCRDMIAKARSEGMYTPPSTKGTIVYPFTGGGTNWGGLAFDEKHDVAYVNTSSAMHLVTLIPRADFARVKAANPKKEVAAQAGAPYGMIRDLMASPFGIPCNPPPWGQLHAIDMHDGHVLWEVPLGTTEDMAPFSEYFLGKTGTPNFGGPIVTAGGLVFIGAAMDNYLRAFDAKTGAELWRGRLPAGGQATPMTYVWKGRQYVVIAAGGHSKANTKRGDEVVAFALTK
jgi:quinoprotein glucose dehydrogenase